MKTPRSSISSICPMRWSTNPLLRRREEPSPPPPREEHKTMRNWLDLPDDLTLMIIAKLGAFEILNSAQQVCTQWQSICKDPCMWRTIDMCNLGIPKFVDYRLAKMCRLAIDRSCGQLVDISVEYFGTDDLLKHIVESGCYHLRRLRLFECHRISDEGLCEMAKKLPLLEELDITASGYVSSVALEAIGRGCPLLKSLKFNQQYSMCNRDAYAIARNMFELRHLQLFRSGLDNSGLRAILNSCPHLESLDLRRCFNVNLEGELGKECAEQIKDLRYPNAPTDDYQFGGTKSRFDDRVYDYLDDRDQARIKNEEIARQRELSESLALKYKYAEWEDIDAIWANAKNQRSHKGKNANSKRFQSSHREKKSTKSEGKIHGRKAARSNHKSIFFEKELYGKEKQVY